MNRVTISNIVTKTILVAFAIAIAALGIVLTIKSGMGSSSMSTLSQGLSRVMQVEVGTGNLILNGVFFSVALVGQRQKMGIGTLMIVVGLGLFINFFMSIFQGFSVPANALLILNIVGILLNAGGIALMVILDFGLGPVELITEMIVKISHWSYRKSKLAFDAVMLIFGITIGGDYGLGTILNVLMFGFVMQLVFEVHKNNRKSSPNVLEEK